MCRKPSQAASIACSAQSEMVLQHVMHCLLGECGVPQCAGGKIDPLRITVRVTDLGMTGYAASAWLEQHHCVIAELATDQVTILFRKIFMIHLAVGVHGCLTFDILSGLRHAPVSLIIPVCAVEAVPHRITQDLRTAMPWAGLVYIPSLAMRWTWASFQAPALQSCLVIITHHVA